MSKLQRLPILLLPLIAAACAIEDTGQSQTDCAVQVAAEATSGSGGIAAAATTSGGDEIAQSFKVTEATTVSAVTLKLIRVGYPVGTLTLRLVESSGSFPAGATTPLATATFTVTSDSSAQTGNVTSNVSQSVVFTLDTAVALVTTKTYWWRIAADYSLSDSDVIQWVGSAANPYSNGKAIYETSTANSWADFNGGGRDFAFSFGCH